MAWPTTKAGTTNVDAGTDLVKNARADIKQNIDNVNAIIDEFDIATPSDGDMLIYNSTSGAWEPGAVSAPAAGTLFWINVSDSVAVPGGRYTSSCSEFFDPNAVISISSNQFSLDAGTYVLFGTGSQPTYSSGGTPTYLPLILRNITDGTDELSISTSGDDFNSAIQKFTIASTKTFEFQINTTFNNVSWSLTMQFRKF